MTGCTRLIMVLRERPSGRPAPSAYAAAGLARLRPALLQERVE